MKNARTKKKSAKKVKKTAVVKTKYGSYTAVFEPGSDKPGYVVTVPKVQGVVSWGDTFAEAKKMVVEAIEGILEVKASMLAESRAKTRITRSHIKIRGTALA